MDNSQRKQKQNTLNDIDDNDRIETGYYLGLFHKSVKCILVEHKKPLSWLAQHAGKSKPWWGYALKDSQLKSHERAEKQSAIVVHGRELKSAVLIANLLRESDDVANVKLIARLEVLRAQAVLNDKINALIRIR